MSEYDINYVLTELKEQHPWLRNYHSKMLQMVGKQIAAARKVSQKGRLSDRNSERFNSFTYNQTGFKFDNDKLKDAWYAFIPVDIAPAKQAVSIQPEKVGSIDLGICNLAAFYAEGQQPIVYSGRAVLSDFVYKTKKIADLHSRLKQKQYTSKKIGLMFRKRTRRFKHAMRAMLKDLFARMKQIGITKVAVGDLTGIRDNNNLGTHTNQKLHNFWSHRRTIE